MTSEEIKQIQTYFGKPIDKIDEKDIPAYIRERELKKEVRQLEAEDRLAEEAGSEEYPIGGMVEPYDIEREKEEN